MPKSYADLLREARAQIDEVTTAEVDALPPGGAAIIDVREASEWEQGHVPGAVHISKSYIEQQIEGARPDRDAPVVLYCAGGVRSLFAAQTLADMGYTNVKSMSGGFQAWKGAGLEFDTPVVLSAEQKQRYSRHLLIPEVGSAGQAKLLGSKALFIGAGGLGSPGALYLAAAGVGTIGLVDFDVVDVSNLQRQIIHTTDRVGERKVESARIAIQALNPEIKVVAHEEMLVGANVERIISGYDVILDGTDTFETRYILNDAAVAAGIPVIHASRLPLRGPAHHLRPVRRPVLPLPVPDPAAARARARLLRGRRPRRRAGHPRPAPGERGAQGAPRDRHDARRPAAPVRCPRDRVHRAEAPPRPGMPGLLGQGRRRAQGRPSDHRGRRRRRHPVRDDHDRRRRSGLARGACMSTVFIPAVLRPNVGGAKSLELEAARSGPSSTRSSSGTRRWAASC